MLGAVSFRALACLWRRGICFLFNPLSHTSRFLPRLSLGMVPRLPLGMVSKSRTMSESRTIASPPPSGGRLGMTVSHFFSLLLEPISKPCDFVHQEGHDFTCPERSRRKPCRQSHQIRGASAPEVL